MKDQVNKLQEHLNSIDPHIKFTIELLETDGLPFLDSLAKSNPNSIESPVYRKPTHKDRYLDYVVLSLISFCRLIPQSADYLTLQFSQFVPTSHSTCHLVLREHGYRYVIAFNK